MESKIKLKKSTLIGGIIATMFMCCIQINRLNKYEEYKSSEDSSDEE